MTFEGSLGYRKLGRKKRKGGREDGQTDGRRGSISHRVGRREEA